MRKRSLVLSLIAVAAVCTPLHLLTAQKMSYGILIGGAASKFAGIDVKAADFLSGTSAAKQKYGLQAGVYINKPLAGNLSLQPELHYVQKGSEFETASANLNLSFSMSYVEVPVLLRADFGSGSLHPFVTVGPTLAYRTSCSATLKGGTSSLNVKCDEFDNNGTKSDPFKSSDLGGTVGAGLTAAMGGRQILASLRYGRGFTTIATDKTAANSSNQNPKNSVISVVFGIGR